MATPRKPDVKLSMKEDKMVKVKSIIDPLMLSDCQMKRVMDTLSKEMVLGLSKDPVKREMTSLHMENTHVRSFVNGSEEGDFLSLDLGGTNFRVLLVQVKNGSCKTESEKYDIPLAKLHGPSVGIFEHLADSIYKFLKARNLLDRHFSLGFTFSFPMVQKSIKKGILVTWTKSFACPDGAGQDAVQLLEEAIQRRGDMKVDIVAILNDTTGTLMAGSYLDKKCGIGLIIGTGCNAAYVEKVHNVDKWTGDNGHSNEVVIVTEWGAFGDNGSLNFVKTEFDTLIDHHSHHKGTFTFEKLFAGHYIGDIVRVALLKLATEGLIFNGHVTEKLSQWTSFKASHISDIERDTDDSLLNTRQLLRDLEYDPEKVSSADISLIRYLCSAVSIRAAQFISASIAVLLGHMKKPEMTVAIDGSLYRYHPKLHNMMMSWLTELAPSVKTKLILVEDGSGRGAAFIAAVAVKGKKVLGHTHGPHNKMIHQPRLIS